MEKLVKEMDFVMSGNPSAQDPNCIDGPRKVEETKVEVEEDKEPEDGLPSFFRQESDLGMGVLSGPGFLEQEQEFPQINEIYFEEVFEQVASEDLKRIAEQGKM